jgi:hypothetical protein
VNGKRADLAKGKRHTDNNDGTSGNTGSTANSKSKTEGAGAASTAANSNVKKTASKPGKK